MNKLKLCFAIMFLFFCAWAFADSKIDRIFKNYCSAYNQKNYSQLKRCTSTLIFSMASNEINHNFRKIKIVVLQTIKLEYCSIANVKEIQNKNITYANYWVDNNRNIRILPFENLSTYTNQISMPYVKFFLYRNWSTNGAYNNEYYSNYYGINRRAFEQANSYISNLIRIFKTTNIVSCYLLPIGLCMSPKKDVLTFTNIYDNFGVWREQNATVSYYNPDYINLFKVYSYKKNQGAPPFFIYGFANYLRIPAGKSLTNISQSTNSVDPETVTYFRKMIFSKEIFFEDKNDKRKTMSPAFFVYMLIHDFGIEKFISFFDRVHYDNIGEIFREFYNTSIEMYLDRILQLYFR